jgi:hypothetical protein
MHDTSMWELVKNSPEWVTVFTNALFAIVTVGVIIWQVCVMKAQVRVKLWQGKNSARHERTQNRLIESQSKLFRAQIEHEWLVSINAERERLLTLGRKLYVAANVVWHSAPNSAELSWDEVRERATLSGKAKPFSSGNDSDLIKNFETIGLLSEGETAAVLKIWVLLSYSGPHVGIQDQDRAKLTRLLVLGMTQWLCLKFTDWLIRP